MTKKEQEKRSQLFGFAVVMEDYFEEGLKFKFKNPNDKYQVKTKEIERKMEFLFKKYKLENKVYQYGKFGLSALGIAFQIGLNNQEYIK